MTVARILRAARAAAGWLRRLGAERGEPGVRCAVCGAPPGAGERLCLDCWASHAAAP